MRRLRAEVDLVRTVFTVAGTLSKFARTFSTVVRALPILVRALLQDVCTRLTLDDARQPGVWAQSDDPRAEMSPAQPRPAIVIAFGNTKR